MARIASIHSYADAQRALGDKSRRVIGHNTVLQHNATGGGQSALQVTLHNNLIASYWPDGEITYSNAGWPTVTTRDRLNQLTDKLRFSQKDHTQYVGRYGETPVPYSRCVYVFADGSFITDLSDERH